MLHVEDLRKSYGPVEALRGVSLNLPAGQILGLLGPNGAGKTTLVSIVSGLRRPDGGRVTVDGIDVLAEPDRARTRIGLAPQETGIYPVITVRQNLKLFGELTGLRGKPLNDAIDEVAEALDITELLARKAGELSGGQKRRLHTGIAMLNRPPLLLLDEATTGTDVTTRRHLLELIERMASEGSAILYSTHYLHEVEELDARVAIIEAGKVIADGALEVLIGEHGGATVELAFDGPVPDIDGAIIDGNVARVRAPDAAATAARLMSSLGSATERLRGVEIINPSLEAVYLSLTGRRYEEEEVEQRDVVEA